MPNNNVTPKKFLELSNESYRNESLPRNTTSEDGWTVIGQTQNHDTGYAAIAYQGPNGEIVIAHRGSDSPHEISDGDISIGNSRKDWLESNKALVEGRVPPQFQDANEFTKNIYNQYEGETAITHTGHSLGGALAQLTAHKYGSDAVTFDNPGVHEVIVNNGDVFGGDEIKHENFKSYLSLNSFVSAVNTQIGEPTKLNIDKLLGRDEASNKSNILGTADRAWDTGKGLTDRHDLNNISQVFGEDGQPLGEFIQDMSTMQESEANQVADFIGDKSRAITDITDVRKIFQDDTLSEREKIEIFDRFFDQSKEIGADAFMKIFDSTFGDLPVIGSELSNWANDKLRTFITSDEVGGLEDVSNKIGEWMGEKGHQFLKKIGLDDDLEEIIRNKMGVDVPLNKEDNKIEELIMKRKEDLEASDGTTTPNLEFELPTQLPKTGADGTISDSSVAGIVQELRTNVDLLFQNMNSFKSSIGGI